ncbi:hypothetical protein FHL15_009242 [Xylaria flabelliformis]|uniref:Uncharacterized protein n=1 Tax=Xylaria flabelliformis TaxID=2512241 RepID=A0A553HPG4_9PEZI|nr:hypothetical protein FHL15_009242 [Xylaria flabelliformis]
MRNIANTLIPDSPPFLRLHDGHVHDTLGGGTLVVLYYAFSVAKRIRNRMLILQANKKDTPPSATVLITFIDTAPDLRALALPKHGSSALRSACTVPGCGLAVKHGRLNKYGADNNGQDNTITSHCLHHGLHAVRISSLAEIARLQANTPNRADYAKVYHEMFLYRLLAAWSTNTSLARRRTPHVLHAPLIVDWSGAKLSKSLYVSNTMFADLLRHSVLQTVSTLFDMNQYYKLRHESETISQENIK